MVLLGRSGLSTPHRKLAKVETFTTIILCCRYGQYLRQSERLRLVTDNLKF